MSCYVANEDSTHERRVWRTTVERVTSLRHLFVKMPNDVQPNTLPKLVVTVKISDVTPVSSVLLPSHTT